jgi:CubicO group peptidase (beta-lactamase class C family)
VTHSTPLPVASLTKSFTSAAVMRLVEQGKVELDQPAQRYLPEFALADPRASRITVAHLLAQTSGIANSSLPARPPRAPRSLAEQIQWLRGATLVSDPGTEYSYCNENYDLLAGIVERVSGQPFERAMEETLFSPLGMRASRVFMTLGEPLPGIASGHTLMFGVPVARELPNGMGSGGGGAVSSANDLAHWLAFQTGGVTVEGERLLSQQSIAAMHTPSFAGSDYGFGWFRAVLPDGTTYVHHSGRFPNMAAHERLLPETGYAFAVVLNGIHPFNAEAASFIAGLTAIVTGRAATVGPPFLVFGVPWGVVADGLLALFILLFVSMGAWGALRARAWATHFAGAPLWRIALRLVPYAALTLAVAASPWLMSAVNRGRRVPLAIVFDQWPPLGILFVVAAAAGATVVAFRCARLLQADGR